MLFSRLHAQIVDEPEQCSLFICLTLGVYKLKSQTAATLLIDVHHFGHAHQLLYAIYKQLRPN